MACALSIGWRFGGAAGGLQGGTLVCSIQIPRSDTVHSQTGCVITKIFHRNFRAHAQAERANKSVRCVWFDE